MEQITISGKTFNAPLRYEEGHELSAGEANALNQTYHENLRNNFAKRVKDAVEAGNYDQDAIQTEFDKYADEYQFGVRSGGGQVRDPVMSEAISIAKNMIYGAMKKKNLTRKSVDAAVITAKAKELIGKRPEIMELARTRVAEAQAAASDDLADILGDVAQAAA